MEYNDIKEGIKAKGLYDFIANNYWRLSKEELKTIILELDYALYRILDNEGQKQTYDSIVENEIFNQFQD